MQMLTLAPLKPSTPKPCTMIKTRITRSRLLVLTITTLLFWITNMEPVFAAAILKDRAHWMIDAIENKGMK